MSTLNTLERSAYLHIKLSTCGLVIEEVGAIRQALGQVSRLVENAFEQLQDGLSMLKENPDAGHNQIARTLQFVDLVTQLCAYSDSELDNIEHLALDLNKLVDDLRDSNKDDAFEKVLTFATELDGRLAILHERLKDRGHKAVLQDSLEEGGVDFF